ncbi:MAG: M36 family metallopeptidase [Limisphaerales bacterium]
MNPVPRPAGGPAPSSRLRARLLVPLLLAGMTALAVHRPHTPSLPDYDRRLAEPLAADATAKRDQAATRLAARVQGLRTEYDALLHSPAWVGSGRALLTGPAGRGGAVLQGSVGAPASPAGRQHPALHHFLEEHRDLFGHGAEVLDGATVAREFVTPATGMKTVVWQQQVEGVPVFEAVLIGHTTKDGALVNLSSRFLPRPAEAAARGPAVQGARAAAADITAEEAVARAAADVGDTVGAYQVAAVAGGESGPGGLRRFRAPPLAGDAHVRQTWLPVSRTALRRCWDVVLTSRARGEMFRVLVDAKTGEVWLRRGLTAHVSEATYQVFTSDSPTPFSPGHSLPSAAQPPEVARTRVVTAALSTNASPLGWIGDGGNETRGNNVAAHLDLNADNQPDLPRPQGSPARTFAPPLDLRQNPGSYRDLSVVQLFYWCNWMHDRLYELGFTEAAGNFQADNLGRGGLGGDALEADAQDGSGVNNANMATPPDGIPPRMQMFVFTGPEPDRDSSLDAEIVLHEYTHGLSNRRVGGGVGISALQSAGMGEGWSDFYGLALLSEPGDDPDATYAAGAYASRELQPGFLENHYFGIRRYPYSTDLAKNPLTFKDVDPSQASPHTGVPISPVMAAIPANAVHAQGEVWCVTLWEARANLIRKHGPEPGNRLILQLVTDGMNLSPPNPNFLQARDAIIQADLVANGGANFRELWLAFAKRGMGAVATSPSSATTSGVREAYDLPDDLAVAPGQGLVFTGPVGGPFDPPTAVFTLANTGTNELTWRARSGAGWLGVLPAGGTLATGAPPVEVTVAVNAAGGLYAAGLHPGVLEFENVGSGVVQAREVALGVDLPDRFTELFTGDAGRLAGQMLTFTPDGSPAGYSVCRETAGRFPTDPRFGRRLFMSDDAYAEIFPASGAEVTLFSRRFARVYVGSNGYLTFGGGDADYTPSAEHHFAQARVTGLLADLNPEQGGQLSWRQTADRLAVTWETVPEYGTTNRNSFQIEMFFDGRVRLTHLVVEAGTAVAGLSAGGGVPPGFKESDLTGYGACLPALLVELPALLRESDGLLRGAGRVRLPSPAAAVVRVLLESAVMTDLWVPAEVTVPAGQSEAAFDLKMQEDGEPDGARRVAVRARADGYLAGAATVLITDAESGALVLVLPATTREDAGLVTGEVSVAAPAPRDLGVAISSGDTNVATAPEFVVIRAGERTATFAVAVRDNRRIRGPAGVTFTAAVGGWPDATATMEVADDETRTLALRLPAEAAEDAGTLRRAGEVWIPGTWPDDLAVTLVSDDPGEAAVPASVVIPAGATNATFDLTLVNDRTLDGDQAVTVTASADGWTGAGAGFRVLDAAVPPVPSNPRPADLAGGVPADTDLAWNRPASLVVNGGFETGDFTGWTREGGGGSGSFVLNDGTVAPASGDAPTPPFGGRFSVFTDPTGPGVRMLFQTVELPAGAPRISLAWAQRIRNFADRFADDAQEFRVEIWDEDGAPLATAFSTQPGDPLLGEWERRSFDLTRFAGRTVRLAFIEIDQIFYLNAHLDEIEVSVPGAEPGRFEVYFGTNANLGAADLLGSTAGPAWDLPVLAPLTTYYWQIVARREGEARGPVWQFTTAGADHFEWAAIPPQQAAGQPFPVHVTARDALGRVVSNHVGTVTLSAGPPGGRTRTVLGDVRAAFTNAADVTVGYRFQVSSNLVVTHWRHLAGQKLSLWAADGRLLASQLLATNGPGWRETPLPAPLRLGAGQSYVLGLHAAGAEHYGGANLPAFFVHGFIEAAVQAAGDAFPTNTHPWQWPLVDFRYRPGTEAPVAVSPGASGAFSDGAWSGEVAVLAPAERIELLATGGTAVGASNPFRVTPAPGTLDHFLVEGLAGAVPVNEPRPVTVSARDAAGAVVNSFTGTAGFSAVQQASDLVIGDGTNTSSFPFAAFFRQARSQVLYRREELGGPALLGGLRLDVAQPPGQPLRRWTIRLKPTTRENLNSTGWETGGWSTVFEGNADIRGAGWHEFVFATPFAYDGSSHLLADFTFDNAEFSFDGECRTTPTTSVRMLVATADGEFGDPLQWSASSGPPPAALREFPNARWRPVVVPVRITPTATGRFTGGVWSGAVTVLDLADGVRLVAADAAGRRGESAPFTTLLANDLSLVAAAPGLVATGDPLTYTFRVRNSGPGAATGVVLTNLLPADVTFLSATATQGEWVADSGQVAFRLGTLMGGEAAETTVTVRAPAQDAVLGSIATLTRDGPDAELANNSAALSVRAAAPEFTAAPAVVTEGDAGTTNAVFVITLSAPRRDPASLHFVTGDGAARAGADYATTNGVLVFPPGVTVREVAVEIFGERSYETDEGFSLFLSVPVNARLAVSSVAGTILNDDPLPVLTVENAQRPEGNAGTANVTVPFRLNTPSGRPVRVRYQTLTGTAEESDFVAQADRTLVIAAGVTNRDVLVSIRGDTAIEPDEMFYLHLFEVTDAAAPNVQAAIIILNDDFRASVRPAGSRLITEPPDTADGVVDPGETVTFEFKLVNDGNLATSNLMATLRATGGIESPDGSQAYGVLAPGAEPVARPFTFTVSATNGATATATLELADGGQSLGTLDFALRVGASSAGGFRITALRATGAIVMDHAAVTGDDAGGIAGSATHLFINGDESSAALSLDNLSDARRIGRTYWGLCSDLRTETAYVLANGSAPIGAEGGRITTLIELNGTNGALTGRRITLSQAVTVGTGTGIFSGYGRVVLHTGSGVFEIEVATGLVTDLGAMPGFEHVSAEAWAYWGVAEHFRGEVHLVYAANGAQIVRRRVPDGAISVVGQFTNLSDMASFTVSPARGRWYFHHEGVSQFGGSDETAGYADAEFEFDSGAGAVDRFQWEPLTVQPVAGEPFPVQLSARNADGGVVRGFAGPVSLKAYASGPDTHHALRGDAVHDEVLNNGAFTLGYGFTPTASQRATHLRRYAGSRVLLWDDQGQVLASQDFSGPGGAWTEAALPVPVPLTAGREYVIGFVTGGGPFYWRDGETNSFEHGRLHGSRYAAGEALPTSPFAGGWWLVDLRYAAPGRLPVTILPEVVTNLVNGVWAGEVTMAAAGDGVILRGLDAAGHRGDSAPFDVLPPRPVLRLLQDGANVILAGVPVQPGWLLEVTADLTPPARWTLVTGASVTGDRLVLPRHTTPGARYFRLRR